MTSERINKLNQISKEVWNDLAKKSESFSRQSLPVNIEEYARDVNIQRIRFRPLISDAGLAKNGDNLEIIINTEAPGVTLPAGTTASIGDGTWPRFQPSLRFTVAHEIAHAFFLRVAANKKQTTLLGKHRPDVEEACKILARLMLLPRQIVTSELQENIFDVDYLSKLFEMFRVSPEVFFRRLHLSDMRWQDAKQDGFITFVQERNGRLYIKAGHILGRHAPDRFHTALQGADRGKRRKFRYRNLSDDYRQIEWAFDGVSINDLNLINKKDIEAVLRSAESSQLNFEVGWGGDKVIPCNLAFRRIHQEPLGLLVRVQVVGPVQKPGQRTLF